MKVIEKKNIPKNFFAAPGGVYLGKAGGHLIQELLRKRFLVDETMISNQFKLQHSSHLLKNEISCYSCNEGMVSPYKTRPRNTF